MASSKAATRILILGGGFAGINILMTLEKLFGSDKNVEIILVNSENFFLFTPMLSEVATGFVNPYHILTPLRELCRKAKFYCAEVRNIDLSHRRVDLVYNGVESCQYTLEYDHLVLSLGSISNLTIVPGAERYAFDFKDIADAMILRNHLLEMLERAETEQDPVKKSCMLTFTVAGGGYSGVEIAASLQRMLYRVQSFYPSIKLADMRIIVIEAQERILPTFPERLSDYAHKYLAEIGLEVKTGARLVDIHPTWVELSTGQQILTNTVIWTTGIVVPPLIRGLSVAKDSKGRPLGTPELRLAGWDNVWAAGDNVLIPLSGKAGFYQATAQSAVFQGIHLAYNLYNAVKGKHLKPFRYEQRGEIVTLGERSGVAQISGKNITGLTAWIIWRLFYLSRLTLWRQRAGVLMDWIQSGFTPLETTQIKAYNLKESSDIKEEEVAPEEIAAKEKAKSFYTL